MEAISIIGMGLAFFFELLLLRKKDKSISDRILAVWMFIIGLHLFSAYGIAQGFHLRWPLLIMIFAPFPMLHGPFLLLYLMSLTRESRKVRWYDLIHFLPYLLGTIPFLPYAQLPGAEAMSKLESLETGAQSWPFLMIGFGIQTSGLIYAVVSYILLQRHRKRMKDQFSDQEQVSLEWLRYLILGIGIIYVVVMASVWLERTSGLLSPDWREFLIYTTVTLFVFLFGYYGIRQESIFTDQPLSGRKTAVPDYSEPDIERYQRSGLKSEQIDQYYQRLLEFMEEEKPFFESRLSLNQLAEHLGLSPNHLSQIINERANQNFYQLVNGYRIRCFKEKLQDPANAHLTLLAIALDCGFNSKSSFNHTFKKMTGHTPSQYQQLLREQS
ncbi:MAG: AraC family transcriptional regulator [Saprospiraceae bacterium]|nr:helix-turn-helix transcriptional regulator [Lewinella sp.]